MFGNVTALEGLHVTGKYRDKSMTHTCSRHAAWDPHRSWVVPERLPRNVKRFRGGLVFKAHRLCVSPNSRLESIEERREQLESFQEFYLKAKTRIWR